MWPLALYPVLSQQKPSSNGSAGEDDLFVRTAAASGLKLMFVLILGAEATQCPAPEVGETTFA